MGRRSYEAVAGVVTAARTAEELRIESYFPADEAAEALVARLASAEAPG